MKNLSNLIDGYKGRDVTITGLTEDSRAVGEGFVFFAVTGGRVDGREFIATAVQSGACAVVAPIGTVLPAGVDAVLVEHENPRRALSVMAAKFYDAQPEMIAAVTGTNGKTSTAHFTQQLWEAIGLLSISIGTVGVHGTHFNLDGKLTTPDPVSLMRILKDAKDAGVNHVCMEASSQGMHQSRIDGVKISAAGFTNLTRDHLDYHGDIESYLAAKEYLFSDLLASDGIAVLNADDNAFAHLSDACRKRGIKVWSYGYNGADISLRERELRADGQILSLTVFAQDCEIFLPLIGEFQAMNALCAIGLAIAAAQDRVDDILAAVPSLRGAPGRLQLVPGHPVGAAVYVDYAHTSDGLLNVLQAVRPHTAGRLVCVFGCGGDRDPGKRPDMGRIAADWADHVIVTDDNPRSENPDTIRAMIMAAAGDCAENIGDRRVAIRHAVSLLGPDDTLVIAGKGHEQGQIIGGRVDPFDDVEEAVQAIKVLSSRTK